MVVYIICSNYNKLLNFGYIYYGCYLSFLFFTLIVSVGYFLIMQQEEGFALCIVWVKNFGLVGWNDGREN